VKDELGLELLDCGASKVFAVVDHQVAHVYVNDQTLMGEVRRLVEGQAGIGAVWGESEKAAHGLNHPRAGDLIAVAKERAWFTYYYWLDDQRAPDFARTVDIHRKPGYDPVELFLDPKIPLVKTKIIWRLLQKKLGFRMLMDVIPLDAGLVKGSHGAKPSDQREWPVFISSQPGVSAAAPIKATEVCELLRRLIEA
jgi:predicted AlkP superfamily pyrophosphatase or phosphodiesterase